MKRIILVGMFTTSFILFGNCANYDKVNMFSIALEMAQKLEPLKKIEALAAIAVEYIKIGEKEKGYAIINEIKKKDDFKNNKAFSFESQRIIEKFIEIPDLNIATELTKELNNSSLKILLYKKIIRKHCEFNEKEKAYELLKEAIEIANAKEENSLFSIISKAEDLIGLAASYIDIFNDELFEFNNELGKMLVSRSDHRITIYELINSATCLFLKNIPTPTTFNPYVYARICGIYGKLFDSNNLLKASLSFINMLDSFYGKNAILYGDVLAQDYFTDWIYVNTIEGYMSMQKINDALYLYSGIKYDFHKHSALLTVLSKLDKKKLKAASEINIKELVDKVYKKSNSIYQAIFKSNLLIAISDKYNEINQKELAEEILNNAYITTCSIDNSEGNIFVINKIEYLFKIADRYISAGNKIKVINEILPKIKENKNSLEGDYKKNEVASQTAGKYAAADEYIKALETTLEINDDLYRIIALSEIAGNAQINKIKVTSKINNLLDKIKNSGAVK